MKSSTLPVLAAIAAALAGVILVNPEAEARRGPSGALSIGHKSGPGSLGSRPTSGPVIRDHRGTVGKLQCTGSYCSTPKKSIIDSVKGTTTGKYKKQCAKRDHGCLHGHTH